MTPAEQLQADMLAVMTERYAHVGRPLRREECGPYGSDPVSNSQALQALVARGLVAETWTNRRLLTTYRYTPTTPPAGSAFAAVGRLDDGSVVI